MDKSLVESELVFQSGVPPQARYLFKHALVQDTAYQSLLKSRRQQLHQQVAQVLEQQFPQTVKTQPELVAHHYTEASLIEQAIPYWQQAGQRANQRSANEEAVTHLTTGLTLLKTLPDTPERPLQELTLQTALGSALFVTKGPGAHEMRAVYDRARELGLQVRDAPQLFPTLLSLAGYYLQQEEMPHSIELAQQCLALAERQQDIGGMLAAHGYLCTAWFFHGDSAQAHEHCEQTMARYDFERHRSLAFDYGLDSGVLALAIGAWALWHLGYPEQARTRCETAVALARQVGHPYSLAWALNAASWLYWYRQEGQRAYELADEAIAFATQHEFPHWVAMGLQMRGIALARLGQWEEGMRQLRQGVEAYQATGAIGGRDWALPELARGCLQRGQYEEGLRLVEEALDLTREEAKGMRHYEPEKYHAKGELLLQQFNVQGSKFKVENPHSAIRNPQLEAEACFLKAIEIAQRQQAKSWELRAATSLARLWQQQGKRVEAHKLLAEIYNWFSEGFETKDLQEANALLEELKD
jgi:predicted ATPase